MAVNPKNKWRVADMQKMTVQMKHENIVFDLKLHVS